MSKLSACICVYSGTTLTLPRCSSSSSSTTTTTTRPPHSVRSLHLPPEALEMEQRRFLDINAFHALRFQLCSAFFLPYSNTSPPFISCFSFFAHFLSHNLSPCSTKSALVSSESVPSCYERTEYESRNELDRLCVCQCYSMTTSHSLAVEYDTASIAHPPRH